VFFRVEIGTAYWNGSCNLICLLTCDTVPVVPTKKIKKCILQLTFQTRRLIKVQVVILRKKPQLKQHY
jgi:hypothetical protein